jgi:hypothetical protein
MNDDMMDIAKELQKLLTKNTETCLIITRGADSIILASSKTNTSKTSMPTFLIA